MCRVFKWKAHEDQLYLRRTRDKTKTQCLAIFLIYGQATFMRYINLHLHYITLHYRYITTVLLSSKHKDKCRRKLCRTPKLLIFLTRSLSPCLKCRQCAARPAMCDLVRADVRFVPVYHCTSMGNKNLVRYVPCSVTLRPASQVFLRPIGSDLGIQTQTIFPLVCRPCKLCPLPRCSRCCGPKRGTERSSK